MKLANIKSRRETPTGVFRLSLLSSNDIFNNAYKKKHFKPYKRKFICDYETRQSFLLRSRELLCGFNNFRRYKQWEQSGYHLRKKHSFCPWWIFLYKKDTPLSSLRNFASELFKLKAWKHSLEVKLTAWKILFWVGKHIITELTYVVTLLSKSVEFEDDAGFLYLLD